MNEQDHVELASQLSSAVTRLEVVAQRLEKVDDRLSALEKVHYKVLGGAAAIAALGGFVVKYLL